MLKNIFYVGIPLSTFLSRGLELSTLFTVFRLENIPNLSNKLDFCFQDLLGWLRMLQNLNNLLITIPCVMNNFDFQLEVPDDSIIATCVSVLNGDSQ